MRAILPLLLLIAVISCNSAKNKDNKSAMDDTARMDNRHQPGEEIRAVKITDAEIPKGIMMSGVLHEAWKWMDQQGENIFVMTTVPAFNDKKLNEYGEVGQTAELHAFHFVKKGDGYNKVWQLSDGVQGCEFDITSNFIKDATSITDLDKNGIAEIKIQYLTSCRSDVSPSEYKLVLAENGKAHRLKGLSWLPYSPEIKFDLTTENANLEKSGVTNVDNDEDFIKTLGRYENEKEFSNTPPVFIEYARNEWVKFVKEKIGE